MAALDFWAPYATVGLIIGLVGIVGVYLWRGKERTRLFAGLVFFFMIVLSLGVFFVPEGGTGAPPGGNGAVGGFIITVPQTEQGGGRDAGTEIFNDAGTDFSLDCVADTPDGTLDVVDTSFYVNRPTNTIEFQYTIDDDAAQSAAGYAAPDCHSNDFSATPKTPIDINNDGAADNQLLWGRVRTIGKTTFTDNSTSDVPKEIFFYTATEGFYISWMQEDSDQTGAGTAWITACPDSIGETHLTEAMCSEWRFLGDTTGATMFVAFAWLFDSAGAWGYNDGFVGESFQIVIDFGHGSAGSVVVDASYTYTVQLVTRT